MLDSRLRGNDEFDKCRFNFVTAPKRMKSLGLVLLFFKPLFACAISSSSSSSRPRLLVLVFSSSSCSGFEDEKTSSRFGLALNSEIELIYRRVATAGLIDLSVVVVGSHSVADQAC